MSGSPAANELLQEFAALDGHPTRGEGVYIDTIRAAAIDSYTSPAMALALARRALELLDTVDADEVPEVLGLSRPSSLRTLATIALGRAQLYDGDHAGASATLSALAADTSALYPVWAVHALGALALTHAWVGRLRDATAAARHALSIARESGLEDHQSGAEAYLAFAIVARERNDLEGADLFLHEGVVRAEQNRRLLPLAVHRIERALLLLALGNPRDGLTGLGSERSAGHLTLPRTLASRQRAVEARLHLALGELDAAVAALQHGGADSTDELGAAARIAIAQRDLAAARKALEQWPDGDTDVRATLERDLLAAIVDDRDGAARSARAAVAQAAARALPDGHVRVFLDLGPSLLGSLRAAYRSDPGPYLRGLVAALEGAPDASRAQVAELPDQLTDRELAVMRFLPSRLSNAEIAEQLFISINTVKTHTRHIYQKLGVDGRRDAVERAERLGLA
jgi:LuxR family maltose regulon positive regulatory protein